MRKKLAQSLMIDFTPLKKFLQRDSELPKEDLIRRIAGEVPYGLLQTLKQLIFNVIGKDANDELYLA